MTLLEIAEDLRFPLAVQVNEPLEAEKRRAALAVAPLTQVWPPSIVKGVSPAPLEITVLGLLGGLRVPNLSELSGQTEERFKVDNVRLVAVKRAVIERLRTRPDCRNSK
ncbi:hypothetical protein [Deinococcus radiophilus]|uniref:hypothetical protein n=1 Tax=Deinococcus radiophilus TaxID=32062 RepID=UPI00361AE3D3